MNNDENFDKTFLGKQVVQALRVSGASNKKLISRINEGKNISKEESKRMQDNMNIMNYLNESLSEGNFKNNQERK